MGKLFTFLKYVKDYLKHGEYSYVLSAVAYTLFKKASGRTSVIRTGLGSFLNRKGSIDFVFANYAYEWNVKKFMLEHYAQRNVFLDIGANIGTYSIMMAARGLKCFAFEPVKENYNALRVNCILNDMEAKVEIFNFGLGDKEKNVDFIFEPVNTGASHLQEEGEKGKVQQVQIKKLDEVYPSLGLQKTDKLLLKIDVEGMEKEVLEGAEKFLKHFTDIILIMESKHSGADKLRAILSSFAVFEFIEVDELNFAARKIKN